MVQFFRKVFSLANHDFCPGFNQYVYWLKKPIGWVVTATAFSILIGIFVGPQGYVLAFAFATLLVSGLVWPWLSMKGVRCQLILPEGRLQENETFELAFEVRNYWPLPVFGLMVQGDFLQDLEPGEEPVAFSLRRIPAWSRAEFRIPMTPRRRGQLPCGESQIVNGFPFGLVDISKPISVPNQALVWPACQPLDGQPSACGNHYSVLGALCDRSGNDGETIGVRAYQNGDRLRNIHWAQSVRSQNLMVRERQTLTTTAATVVVDLAPETHTGSGVENSFEWAIRIAASVCWRLHETQSNVQLFFVGLPWLEQTSSNNRRGIKTLMDSFSLLPTLDAARETSGPNAEQGRGSLAVPSGSEHRFFVGTSLSKWFEQFDEEVKSIMLDLDGFTASDTAGPSKKNRTSSALTPSLLITKPQLAGEQLAADWTGRFCHAGT